MTPTETYRKLLREKCPPTTEHENVYASVVLALSETVDTLRAQVVELSKALHIVAGAVAEINSTAPAGAAKDESGSRDQTPFPAGVKAKAESAEIPTPDVVGQPAVNAAPIPKKVVGNGSDRPKGVA